MLDNIANKMEADVDVFGVCVILMIFREFNGRLVVQEEGGSIEGDVEDLGDE